MSFELIHADSLEAVGKLPPVDYVITDPPYPIGGNSSMGNLGSVLRARAMIDTMSQSLIAGVMRQLTIRRALWLMSDWRQVSFLGQVMAHMGYAGQSCIVWDKVHQAQGQSYQRVHEMVLFAYAGNLDGFRMSYPGPDLISEKRVRTSEKEHPFDKPPMLAERLVQAFKPGVILDPFCGGGGLLVGCQRLGFDVIGIDADRPALEVAEKRLSGQLL